MYDDDVVVNLLKLYKGIQKAGVSKPMRAKVVLMNFLGVASRCKRDEIKLLMSSLS